MVAEWNVDQMDAGSISSEFNFFFIPNLKDVVSNTENNKSIKCCLHKYEIFSLPFSFKGLLSCSAAIVKGD